MSAPVGPPGRVEILEPLRGFAALAVAWFHFTHGGPLVPEGTWLYRSGEYGWLGVEMFFVISGFVIPYSMHRAGYRLGPDTGRFLLKRIIRLDPPYLVTIGLTIALAYASAMAPGFQGESPAFSGPQLLAHLGYLNTFLGYGWLSPVFWTLAIEFQYYLLAAVTFPLLVHPRAGVRLGVLAALALTAFAVASNAYIFHYGGLFAMGGATFLRASQGLSNRTFVAVVAGLAAVTAAATGPLMALVGLATALAIAFMRLPHVSFLAWLGTVSYSLYLLHVPFGGRVVNLGARVARDSLPLQLAVLAAAVGVSLAVSWALYRWVERPAQRWSSAIRYRRTAPPVLEPAL